MKLMAVLKRLLLNSVLAIASILVALAIAEVGLRVLGFQYPPFHQPDPVTGLSLRPDTSGEFHKEGRAYVSINSDGLRDRERPVAKPAGTYRIVVLGDSYTEALQVDVDKAFWRLLEQRLQACAFRPGKTIDVVNFGVSGFGTAQELRMLQTRGPRYEPDLVLLAFFPGNDVRNNSRELETDTMRPFYVLDDGGRLRLDDSFARSEEFRRRSEALRQAGKELSKWSRTLQLLYYAKDLIEARREAPGAGSRPAGNDTVGSEPGLDDQVFAAPRDQRWDRAWRLTERLILEVRQTAAEMKSDFAAVTLTVGAQVDPDKAVRDAFAKRLGVEDLWYPERRLAQFAQRTDTRVIHLGMDMLGYAEEHKAYLHGFANTRMGSGHWNEAGHAEAAKLLAGALCGAPRAH
jgi:hypothetical protein